jgi:dynein heavy chain
VWRILQVIEPLFIFSIVWSVGASCDNDGRLKFDTWMKDLLAGVPLKSPPPADFSLFGCRYDHVNLQWDDWMSTIPSYVCDRKKPFAELIVPTADSVGYKYVVHALVMIYKHILCVGETGTGKTLVVRDKLLNFLDNQFIPMFINFSARTGANQTQVRYSPTHPPTHPHTLHLVFFFFFLSPSLIILFELFLSCKILLQ